MGFFKNLGEELGTGAGKGTTTLISSLWKGLCVFCSWFFRWQHKDDENELHTNSFRIAIGSLLLALFFVPGLVTCTFSPSKILSFSDQKNVRLSVPLHKQEIPYFPKSERFAISYEQGVQLYSDFGEKRLYTYHRKSSGKTHSIIMEGNSCAIVPSGEKIILASSIPPMYVANIEDKVTYIKKYEYLTFFEKIHYFFDSSSHIKKDYYLTSSTWEYLNTHWETVASDIYAISTRALDKKDIDPNTAGGLVCF